MDVIVIPFYLGFVLFATSLYIKIFLCISNHILLYAFCMNIKHAGLIYTKSNLWILQILLALLEQGTYDYHLNIYIVIYTVHHIHFLYLSAAFKCMLSKRKYSKMQKKIYVQKYAFSLIHRNEYTIKIITF